MHSFTYMFECNNVCVPCKFLDIWTNFGTILLMLVYLMMIQVCFIVFMSTIMTDVGINDCMVSMQLNAICVSCCSIYSCFATVSEELHLCMILLTVATEQSVPFLYVLE